MRLLLDENLPKRLKSDLKEHEIYTAADNGWTGISNGKLLELLIETSILLIFLGACAQKSEVSAENASREFCNCFNSQTTWTVDERLSPCLQNIANKKNKEWNDSGILTPDSFKVKNVQV
jgi:hypothetical protein